MITKSLVKLGTKILFCGTFFILIVSDTIWASDVTAKSCSAADIQSAINTCISTGGGTVNIPACSNGTNGSTWQNGDYVCFNATSELHILGAGADSTVIKYASGAKPPSVSRCGGHPVGSITNSMFQAHGIGFKELGFLTLSGNDDDALTGGGVGNALFIHACENPTGMTDVRIHHAKFLRAAYHSGGSIAICQNPNSTLLIDHCSIGYQYLSSGNHGNYGITLKGPNIEWSEPVTGFGGNNGVFIEDNTFDGTYHPIAGFGTTRFVARHNTFGRDRSSALEQHGPSYGSITCCENQGAGCTGWGLDQACYAGSYRAEIYDNLFLAPTYGVYVRTGHWIITDNEFRGYDPSTTKYPIAVTIEPSSAGPLCKTAYGCPRSSGFAASGSCPNTVAGAGCWDTPHAVYAWNNKYADSSGSPLASNYLCRDQSAHGGECVAIWGSNSDCLRFGTEIFNRAPQAGDPEIKSYTKYTYPHPLASGGSGTYKSITESPTPSPPKNLRIIP